VLVGPETILDRAIISGNHITIGRGNRLAGTFQPDNVTIGNGNYLDGVTGINDGTIVIGDNNRLIGINIAVTGIGQVVVGDHNELRTGLNLNVPFGTGRILIGHHNSLGRDGGGVISTSYRFGRKWSRDVFIGNCVESTRGAEILGFTALGWPPALLSKDYAAEDKLVDLFVRASLRDLARGVFESLGAGAMDALRNKVDKSTTVSLFGPAKVKRCCLCGKVTVKDDTRIQSSFVRGVLIPERCNVRYSSFTPPADKILVVGLQERAFRYVAIASTQDWSKFPPATDADEYPASDAEYYNDYSWDEREGPQLLG
jgi:hypothetical protein